MDVYTKFECNLNEEFLGNHANTQNGFNLFAMTVVLWNY